jgi:colanic acid/amylovoran biosynthesis glycosyltransferase
VTRDVASEEQSASVHATPDLRIAHVIPHFLAPSETFIYTQLQAQKRLDQLVIARTTANREWFPFAAVVETRSTEGGRWYERLHRSTSRLVHRPNHYQSRIVDAAQDFGATVLHAHFGWSGAEAVLPAQRLDIPLVTAFHGSDVYVRKAKERWQRTYAPLFRAGAFFTCVGPRAGEELVERGAPSERLRLVPVGIDLASFGYRDRVPPGPFTVLQVSRLTAKKGVDLTLRAFAELRESISDARLWIAGDGPLRGSLATLAARLGIADSVTFFGALEYSRIRDLMSEAHLGVQPSRVASNGDREGTPTALLEFQSVGVEIVATRHADIPSIVSRPEELVEENDAQALAASMLAAGLRDAESTRQRTAAARAFVEERHDAGVVAEKLAEVYAEAVAMGEE